MRKMKDSGIEWIGQIPEDWKVLPFKYVMHKIKDIQEHYTGEDIISLSMNGVVVRDLTAGGKMPTTFDGYQKVYSGNLLLCLFDIDVTPRCVGLIKNNGVTSPAYSQFCLHENGYAPYYDYLLRYIDNKKVFVHLAKNLRRSLTETDFGSILSILPPLNKQHSIATYLDRKCSEIDSIVRDTEQTIEEYKKFKQSLITEVVTGKKRVAADGLSLSNEPHKMKDSGIEWIGEIPEEWEVLPYKYVMHKVKNIQEHYSGEDIISLSMNGVVVRDLTAGGKMPTTFDGYQKVYAGNLLQCLFDIDVTPRCVGLIKNNGVTSPAYSQFCLHENGYAPYYDYLLRYIDDKKIFVHLAKNLRSSLTETDFGAILTILPPKEEQTSIATYLDTKCSEIDKLIADKQTLLQELDTYKKSLIYECVTGKREVN